KDQIIEVTLKNLGATQHPLHLHGHRFQLLSRGSEGEEAFPQVPMRLDSVSVDGFGSAVIRFKADNPGVWLIHCHIEWHVPMGMVATFIEEPRTLQESVGIVPQEHLAICEDQSIGTEGNAAGNAKDYNDLRGAASAGHIPSSVLGALVCLLSSCLWLAA